MPNDAKAGRPRGVLWPLAVVLLLSLGFAPPARAVEEWYDHYLGARELTRSNRCAEALKALQRATALKPTSAVKERTYGLEFIDYFPYYDQGVCFLRLGDNQNAIRLFNIEEKQGAIKQTDTYRTLTKLRRDAEDAERQRVARGVRQDVERFLREAADFEKAQKYDEALARLASAEALARELDPGTLRSVTEARERVRTDQKSAADATERTQRIERNLSEAQHLLDEGKPSDALLKFRVVLEADPRNSRAGEGQRLAEERIRASTTRQTREEAFERGKALFESGQYEPALGPLAEAAADASLVQARELLERAQRFVEAFRTEREQQLDINRRLARGESLMAAGQYPEAQVAFDAVLQIDPANARARERLDVALQRTGESLLARWLPDQLPLIHFFEPRETEIDAPTVSLQGLAADDRGIARIEFFVGGVKMSEVVPAPSRDVAQRGSLRFQREFPLVPGPNEITVTATDNGGQEQSETLRLERRLRIWETRLFMPSAVVGALGLLGAGFVVQRVRRRHALRRRFNPYIAGAPVLDDEMIFGREKLLQRILNVLHHNSLMITGERRIGKTTFLYHLKRHLETEDTGDYRFFPVFTDLQGVPETGLFHALMSDIVEQLKPTEKALESLRFRTEVPSYEGRDFSHDLQRIIEDLKERSSRNIRLALLIDEVDVLNEYSEKVNQRLRAIFMKTFAESLVAVMSGVGIKRAWKSEVSPWYNFFDEIEISVFAREEAEALIREPVSGVFRYAPEAVERILDLSRLKPYLIQKLCVHAVNCMIEDGRTTVTLRDVETAQAVTGPDHDLSAPMGD